MKRIAALRLASAIAFAALTLLLAGRMLWFLGLSVTNTLHYDQWPMLEEIRQHQSGQLGWSYLWAPYWGHRIVIPRLIFF